METRNNLCRIALLAGAALLSTGAMAKSVAEVTITETTVVRYSVTESASQAGADALYRKLRSAAASVCSSKVPATNIPFVDRKCADEALGKAVAEVGNPIIIALHRDMQGGERMATTVQPEPAKPSTLASR